MSKKLFAGAGKCIFEQAKVLRKRQTAAEELLWMYLKQKPFGFKFRRQHPFGIYILDFYCHPLQLGIEVDGCIHEDPAVKQYDLQREYILKQIGIQVMRFTNQEVMADLTNVQQQIEAKINELGHDPRK